jgi:hypothetical protein
VSLERLDPRTTKVPGERVRVTLDVAEASLPTLLEGFPAARVWLTDEGDGVYAFHADLTLGESRKQPGKPAIDILTDLVNEFADALDDDDVPERLRARWDALVDEYKAQTGKAKRQP